MTTPNDPIQEIAHRVLSASPSFNGTALLYAEVENGVISADLFFQSSPGSVVQFRFATTELRDLIYAAWESGFANTAPKSWATMQLMAGDGRVNVNLQYPDQIDQNEDLSDRRPRIISTYFPGAKIDYSKASLRT